MSQFARPSVSVRHRHSRAKPALSLPKGGNRAVDPRFRGGDGWAEATGVRLPRLIAG
jgi:hypothetical protein